VAGIKGGKFEAYIATTAGELAEFIESDPTKPIVVGSYPHPRARWRAPRTLGQQHLTQHQGTTTRLDERGNIGIDTTAATRPDGETAGDGKSGSLVAKLKAAAQFILSKGTSLYAIQTDGSILISAGAGGYIEYSRARHAFTITGPQGQFLTMSESGIFCVDPTGHFWSVHVTSAAISQALFCFPRFDQNRKSFTD